MSLEMSLMIVFAWLADPYSFLLNDPDYFCIVDRK